MSFRLAHALCVRVCWPFPEFYAPWCGHCKSLESVWNELSDKMIANRDSGERSAIIAKVDGTENSYLGGKFAVHVEHTRVVNDHFSLHDKREDAHIVCDREVQDPRLPHTDHVQQRNAVHLPGVSHYIYKLCDGLCMYVCVCMYVCIGSSDVQVRMQGVRGKCASHLLH
jgi:hypothetical protein